jgi:hypothetical protein
MLLDDLQEIAGAPIMYEEDALPKAPERSAAEL